ncbi:hypothetical protein T265_06263 [Opisthorchis viverrini]|uniref:Uncharacterized protein n=1 Tax=Opisthorchis viverrini TaxID=6198 RepID=A0A074ZSV8_OPIVI|nr:hypothetical protein T265_06263 [Opisthorchis viverrini]KER26470.1 hypothetical protein T265_06263 [Opisthorchis viverrini]
MDNSSSFVSVDREINSTVKWKLLGAGGTLVFRRFRPTDLCGKLTLAFQVKFSSVVWRSYVLALIVPKQAMWNTGGLDALLGWWSVRRAW